MQKIRNATASLFLAIVCSCTDLCNEHRRTLYHDMDYKVEEVIIDCGATADTEKNVIVYGLSDGKVYDVLQMSEVGEGNSVNVVGVSRKGKKLYIIPLGSGNLKINKVSDGVVVDRSKFLSGAM